MMCIVSLVCLVNFAGPDLRVHDFSALQFRCPQFRCGPFWRQRHQIFYKIFFIFYIYNIIVLFKKTF